MSSSPIPSYTTHQHLSSSHLPTISLPSSSTSLLLPISILIAIVLASAVQTEFAHTLTAKLGYDQPYFTFYLTHSTFALLFPIHLLFLSLTSKIPYPLYIDEIRNVIIDQLEIPKSSTWRDILPIWSRKIAYLTMILSIPALSWYVAMGLSPPVDITAIYSTSAFATYGFSMMLLGQPLSRITMGSIALAFTGVVVISVDGLGDVKEGLMGRVVGDGIMLFGAIILGLYEVIYKLALPEGHGGVSPFPSNYTPLPTHHSDGMDETPLSSGITILHRPIFPHQGTDSTPTPIELTPPLSRTTSNAGLLPSQSHHHVQHQVKLPPALHANFITSCIGIATLLLLWPPILLLDWTGYEKFHWPDGENVMRIWGCLGLVFAGGTIYNAGLMVLIGLWGPTTSSVANLLTIGLVALIDSIWLGQIPDLQTLLGVGMICVGFGVLLWEGEG
ncbi:hypothetical protein I302_108841 [Kwoniella bestiolae CBS 10118]|uniref:EamA domain-containing protein n=1 Tax=Kwoniella bestiolae CBS 10118 TaxID=1296100 RepID=A0A1B9FU79_9TREE|nr:hypothetical protein I302_07980 [Kwoniella bestiolae CBS 10118]OCF22333.1 hypothetical protein I302_07980 [Kwoniella bestiolae CBS 10118]